MSYQPTIWVTFLFLCCAYEINYSSAYNNLIQAGSDSTSKDRFAIKESFRKNDLIVNEYLLEELQPIRTNYKKLNSISNKNWAFVITKEIFNSTEGGEAKFYYFKKSLNKIIVRNYGEQAQKLIEYYLLDNELSLVIEKTLEYKRPIFYDSVAMLENADSIAFSIEESELLEDRSYFMKGKLIHQINNQDCGSPFAEAYLLEQEKRILDEFGGILKLVK